MKRKSWKLRKIFLSLLLSAVMAFEPAGTAMVSAKEEPVAELLTEEPAADEAEVSSEGTEQTGEEGLPADAGEDTDKEDGASDDAETSETPADGENQGPNPSEEEKGEGQETEKGEIREEEPGEEDGTSEDEPTEKEPAGEDVSEEERPEEMLPEEEAGEGVSENNLPEEEPAAEELAEKEEDLGGFTGMPDHYRLSSMQIKEKRLLANYMEDVDESAEGIQYVEGEVMTLAQSEEEAALIAEAYNAEIKSFADDVLVLELGEETTVCDAVQAAASARTLLPAVWPNYYRYVHGEEILEESDAPTLDAYAQAFDSFDDPYLKASNSNYQWQHVAVGSPYAWSAGYRGAGVKVAVLDTGVKASHSDLQIQENINKVTGADSAEDGHGHGTHVAGIIGARVNNGKGGAGIAPEAEIYNIRVMNSSGSGTDTDIIAGLSAAVEQDVDIINMSLGGPGYNGIYQAKINEAYEAGIAVIVSAGNDGVSCINYPACYDHVICVAATDTDNNRADFSTFGEWVDLSAPGDYILSTYKSSDTSYVFMSGTSQACPVISGEAAVLLGSYEPLKSMEKGSGKVDELERVLKNNCVKAAGSGMGKGIPSLTKAFKLSTAVAKPTAPVIEMVPDDKAQKVTVTIKAQGGMTVYYTDNGKTPAFKNGEPGADAIQYTEPFVLEKCAKATVKAIAVNENGVSSAVKSAACTLKSYVADIEISGVQQVAAGKSIQLSAQVTAYATNKKVSWEVYTAGADGEADKKIDPNTDRTLKTGVSISSNGKVTASKSAQPGSYVVKVTAQDDGKKSAEYKIEVISGLRVKSVRFLREKTGRTALKSVTLTRSEGETTYDFTKHLDAAAVSSGVTLTAADFKWTSSNKQVAAADADNPGIITLKKAGRATITALANDSSGKKATCTLTVKQLATGLKVSGPSGSDAQGNEKKPVSVAVGKSVVFKAEVTPKETANKKVIWSLSEKNGSQWKAVDKNRAKEIGVSINANNGKVSTTSKAVPGEYLVKAVTADGSGKEETAEFQVRDGSIEKFEFSDRKDAKVTLYRKKSVSDTLTKKTVDLVIKEKGTADLDAYKVTNSRPGIATVEQTRSGNTITLTVEATGKAAGKTTITVASTDGANKKLTCVVTVVNPVSRLHISSKTITARVGNSVDMCVVQGKSIQLKAALESEYGRVSSKKVAWSINAPESSGVNISSSGKVTASKTAWTGTSNIWTVTAVAKDGSNVKDTYKVMAVPKATYVTASELYEGRKINVYDGYFADTAGGTQKGYKYVINTDVQGGYVQASSSNKKVVEVTTFKEKNKSTGAVELKLWVTPRKPGAATITLKATDGSGVKIRYKVRVENEEL